MIFRNLYTQLITASFACFAFLCVMVDVHAQSIGAPEPGISFSVIPEFPEPEGVVEIRAQSFDTNLDTASFTWRVNNETVKSGIGAKSVSFRTGKSGSGTTVLLTIRTESGVVVERQFGFKPGTVTLVSEALSYTPPFYKGQPLLARGGSVRISAIPEFFTTQGKRLDPKTLLYTWKMNGETLGKFSGYGKNSITLPQTSYTRESDEISVEVFAPTEKVAGTGSILIQPTDSRLVLYEESPTLGVLYNHALNDTITINKKEFTLVSVPLFMSAFKPTGGNLDTLWSVNGSPIPELVGKDRVTIPSISGEGVLSVSVRNKGYLLQGGDRNISLTTSEN